MKGRIIFAVFGIMMFAVMANAQGHVRVFDGSGYSPLIPMAQQSTSTTDIPVLNLIAGQPIRVHVAADRGKDEIIIGAGTTFGHVKTTAIPCRNVPSTSVRKAGGDQQEYLTITMKDVMVSSTERPWRNTCRLLTVELRDGSKYIGKIRFR